MESRLDPHQPILDQGQQKIGYVRDSDPQMEIGKSRRSYKDKGNLLPETVDKLTKVRLN
jgi:hypothetical protein